MEENRKKGENLISLANEKILEGKNLIDTLDNYKNITGVQKIQRKINQEIKFLQKVLATNSVKVNHVMCSNLTHYAFLVKVLKIQRDLVHIDCGFVVDNRLNPLRVDIVCENGLKWIKVIARNAKSLNDAAHGRASYGARSIIDQAEEFMNATEQNLCMFKRPKVVFYFSQYVEDELKSNLEDTGIEVTIMNTESDLQFKNVLSNAGVEFLNVNTLNLDITTMIAYVSSLTNGSCNWIFKETILTEQSERERITPLKPILDKVFEGKRLVCCETALKSFQDIVNFLAGPSETQRANKLISELETFPDVEEISDELSTLNVGGKIKPRSLKIFAFGNFMKALTVTSNEGFIRSAKMQGVNIPVFIHQARALTEMKEQTAIPATCLG